MFSSRLKSRGELRNGGGDDDDDDDDDGGGGGGGEPFHAVFIPAPPARFFEHMAFLEAVHFKGFDNYRHLIDTFHYLLKRLVCWNLPLKHTWMFHVWFPDAHSGDQRSLQWNFLWSHKNEWYTPPKVNIEPENDGLVQMIFLFQGARILRFQPLIFRGFSPVNWGTNRKIAYPVLVSSAQLGGLAGELTTWLPAFFLGGSWGCLKTGRFQQNAPDLKRPSERWKNTVFFFNAV